MHSLYVPKYIDMNTHKPQVVIGPSDNYHAVVCSNLFPELLHVFRTALQCVLTDHKQHWSLHIQQWIINILSNKIKMLASEQHP